ncbi:MAG: ECF-type sigma factor [Acidobacteriota bacterium]
MPADPTITTYLEAHAAGDPAAFGQLVDVVYGHLRYLARRHIARAPHASLSSCALVHEAYLKLEGAGGWRERGHFFAAASRAMRHVLVDGARRRQRHRRGGGVQVRVDLEADLLLTEPPDAEMLALDAALHRLESRNPRLVRVVECRFFAGLSEPEAAEALELSLSTVQRDWRAARAWLARELGGPGSPAP